MSERDEDRIFADEILERIDRLAACSETPGELTRVFLSDQQRQANDLVAGWMRDAGMEVHVDAIGNVVGRYEGRKPGLPALLLGSHLDTVRNAGKFDGMLGVLSAISCVKALNRTGERLDFAVEVIGFADEEGIRFQTSFAGSSAIAGTFDRSMTELRDVAGVSMAEALRDFGLDPDRIEEAAKRPEDVLAYFELHIEQGPVLEAEGLPVGVVTSIAGATRMTVEIEGMAGHAGTVPMGLRQDALTAASECVMMVERRCGTVEGLVGTVGELTVSPGAMNVIPGNTRFTIDVRSGDDETRRAAVEDIESEIEAICARRGTTVRIKRLRDSKSCPCVPWLMERAAAAIEAEGIPVRRLQSGAGHDAMAMQSLTDVGMLFVRCNGGISHNPLEGILAEDAETSARVLLRFIRDFEPRPGTA